MAEIRLTNEQIEQSKKLTQEGFVVCGTEATSTDGEYELEFIAPCRNKCNQRHCTFSFNEATIWNGLCAYL